MTPQNNPVPQPTEGGEELSKALVAAIDLEGDNSVYIDKWGDVFDSGLGEYGTVILSKDELLALCEKVAALIDAVRLEADNNSRNTLHAILSEDVDSALDHSDIEAIFENRLAQLKQPAPVHKSDKE